MRLIDAHGSYTVNANDNTGYSFAFGGGIISVADEFGHIVAEFDADDAPTIEAEPVKHGRWIMQCDGSQSFVTGEWDENYYIECSECGRKVWDIDQDAAMFGKWEKIFKAFPYCHCGAKMDGGAENG